MRILSGVWCVAVVAVVLWAARSKADEIVGNTHQTEHYELYYQGDLDAAKLGKLLESLHAKLTRYFGSAPKERLRIEILADEDRFKQALEQASQPYESGGGIYGPTFKTAWLFVQPSRYYTHHLLLHEATHQFHYLVATGNEAPSAEWYAEGLADYMGLHTWDGEDLTVGVVPLVSLEDYASEAVKQLNEADWDLAAIVPGTKKIGRGAGWMLVHFLINRDYPAFRQFAARLDRRDDPGEAFAATFGEITEGMVEDLRQWVTQRQQPFADVWINWQPWGECIEGYSDVVALCLAKQTPARFETEMRLVDGYFKGGIVFGFQDPDDFHMLQLWADRKARILRREKDRWVRVSTMEAPRSEENDRLLVEQLADDQVCLAVNGKVVQRMRAPGQVGLTVDGCRVRFQFDHPRPAHYLPLSALMDAAAKTELADAGAGQTNGPRMSEEHGASSGSDGQPAQTAADAADSGGTSASRTPTRFDANRRDAEGRTLLQVAALEGDLPAAEQLLAAGADVELTLPNGVTPLMMAAFKGHREITELLVKAGADVRRVTPRGTTALHYAAARGDLAVVRTFLDAGARVDAKKPGGTTPLILAAQNGHAAVIPVLTAAGADANARLAETRITGLMLAAQNGHARAVNALLHAGADWRLKDGQAHTANDFARANEHTNVVKILEEVIAEEEEENGPVPDK